jgi:hypothetical protein
MVGYASLTHASTATKQSALSFRRAMDCFAEFIIGRRFASTRWFAIDQFGRSPESR